MWTALPNQTALLELYWKLEFIASITLMILKSLNSKVIGLLFWVKKKTTKREAILIGTWWFGMILLPGAFMPLLRRYKFGKQQEVYVAYFARLLLPRLLIGQWFFNTEHDLQIRTISQNSRKSCITSKLYRNNTASTKTNSPTKIPSSDRLPVIYL